MTTPAQSDTSAPALPALGFVLLAGLSLFWGLNWPGMKIIMAELPAWWFRASCSAVGGLSLLAISAASGNTVRLPMHEVPKILVCGLFSFVGWLIFSAYGVALIAAGRAAVIAFTMPVWAAVFASLILGEKFTRSKVVGLALGICGLVVLVGPDIVAFQEAPIGVMLMLGAALSWGFGTTLFKRFTWTLPVASTIGWQLTLATIPILAIAIATEPFPDVSGISHEATLALLYIYGFPMIFCQWAYFKTVNIFPASIAAVGTLMVPIVGVYSSHIILGEPVGVRELASMLLISAALASVLIIPNIGRRRARRDQATGL